MISGTDKTCIVASKKKEQSSLKEIFKGLLEKAEAEKELIELEQRQAELEKKRDDGLARAKIVNKRKLEAPLKANKKRKKANKSKPNKFKTMLSFLRWFLSHE